MELDSREGAAATWEQSLMAFTHAPKEARTFHDASLSLVGAVQSERLQLPI
jgi:hypothetical protein